MPGHAGTEEKRAASEEKKVNDDQGMNGGGEAWETMFGVMKRLERV
jgi:hypothetical protein